jgi:regulator of replication initiation timing
MSSKPHTTALEERLSEFEAIVLEQRQQLLSMAEENSKLRRDNEQLSKEAERV